VPTKRSAHHQDGSVIPQTGFAKLHLYLKNPVLPYGLLGVIVIISVLLTHIKKWKISFNFLKKEMPKRVARELGIKLSLQTGQFRQLTSFEAGYFQYSKFRKWESGADDVLKIDVREASKYKIGEDLYNDISEFEKLVNTANKAKDEFNIAYIAQELERQKEFFDDVKPNPLDSDQRKAVICDEDHTLILAGAGSGKTAVIATKAAYLVQRQKVDQEKILLMTFSNAGVEAVENRVAQMIGKHNIDIKTIHSLGLEIITRHTNKKPLILKGAEKDVALRDTQTYFINELFESLFKSNETFQDQVFKYFSAYLKPYLPDYEFTTEEEWVSYLKDLGPLYTFSGDKVKSLEEKQICDFLHRNGIKFSYEMPYEHDTATKSKRQYLPDFYLTDYGIYFEHFGIDRNGNPPKWWEAEERVNYKKWMEWKSNLHKEKETKLICTYSYQKFEGTLEEDLKAQLLSLGVELKPKAIHLADMKKRSELIPFVTLLEKFINLHKASGKSLSDLRSEAVQDRAGQKNRFLAFLDVYEIFFEGYQSELSKQRMIDFGDMIQEGYKAIEDGFDKLGLNYKYIIVDEFQDTSSGAFRLLKGIKDRAQDCRLYVVGDDWQAIYGFAGSEVGIIKNFETRLVGTKVIEMGMNYRSYPNVVELGKKFILKNPAQRYKDVKSNVLDKKLNQFIKKKNKSYVFASLKYHLEVEAKDSKKRLTGFVLGRYKADVPEYFDDLKKTFPHIRWEFKTVHQSKGLEADYVIIVSPKEYGFPNMMKDELLLNLVSPEKENYEHAEERRVMYVAITRAKKQVFFIGAERPEGPTYKTFLTEIENMLKSN
jgi:DNA helicase-4